MGGPGGLRTETQLNPSECGESKSGNRKTIYETVSLESLEEFLLKMFAQRESSIQCLSSR